MTPNDDPLNPFRHAVARVVLVTLPLLGGCVGAELTLPAGPQVDPDQAAQCLSNRDYFAQEAWPAVFGNICVSCHAPGGEAVEDDAAFQLLPANYPGFIEANLAAVTEMARNEYDGVPLLLAKPSGLTDHGGGTVITAGDPNYQVLEQLIERLREGEPCDEGETSAEPEDSGLVLLGPSETYRKASLHLAGRLPTDAELERLKEDGDKALAPLLGKLMKEEAFYVRLKEMYNDIFLSDRYYRNSDAVNLLNEDAYPLAGEWFDAQPEETRRAINRALAREPLELLAHIVRSGKPFTELLTANYTVVNPYSAQLYGLDIAFDDPMDESEWRETKIRVWTDGARVTLPHAGILTNPIWLNRFPTSDTNRNRHRARMVMQQFLATDILKVAERPINALDATKYNNPTRDDPSCASCHRQLDPIAGTFMKWDDDDQEEFIPQREWYREMFPPGFGDELIPVSEFDAAPRWLGKRLAADPRFALSAVRQMYSALTGHAPLEYPAQGLAGYPALLSAWEAQDRVFRQLIEAFVESGYDLKVVIREVVLTRYFRAANFERAPSSQESLSLADIGTGRLSIPELLDRKIAATIGFGWQRDYDGQRYLRGDYAILYGGIDSDTATNRLTDLNSVMSGIQWRMSNEVACVATPFEFSQAKSARLLFKYVDIDTTPIADDGTDNLDAIEDIKKTIQYLHERMWGTRPALDDAELDATYNLFVETWREGLQGVASKAISDRLPYNCGARRNPITGKDLPESQRLEQDSRYTVRAWMAVLTYLMTDYQFLYE